MYMALAIFLVLYNENKALFTCGVHVSNSLRAGTRRGKSYMSSAYINVHDHCYIYLSSKARLFKSPIKQAGLLIGRNLVAIGEEE